jgi:hypothetical protein
MVRGADFTLLRNSLEIENICEKSVEISGKRSSKSTFQFGAKQCLASTHVQSCHRGHGRGPGLSDEAGAGAPLGSAKRVDKDTGTSEVYWLNTSFRVTRTGTGGFAVAWEGNTISEAPNPII